MNFIDASVGLSEKTPTFPGNPAFRCEPVKRTSKGDSANVTQVTLGTHSGTHVDAPLHFFDGTPAVDRLPLDILIGPALVVEVPGPRRAVEADDLKALEGSNQTRVLLKTSNSELWASPDFHQNFAFLDVSGARYLVEHGVRLVGIDYLSIEQFKRPGAPVHHLLLENGIIIVEGLNLRDVRAGVYEMFCLPLKLVGADGAPARVVLRELDLD